MSVLQFIEHGLDGCVIVGEGFTNAGGQARIVDQVGQALFGQREVSRTAIKLRVRLLFRADPGPFWQLAERPLQYVH